MAFQHTPTTQNNDNWVRIYRNPLIIGPSSISIFRKGFVGIYHGFGDGKIMPSLQPFFDSWLHSMAHDYPISCNSCASFLAKCAKHTCNACIKRPFLKCLESQRLHKTPYRKYQQRFLIQKTLDLPRLQLATHDWMIWSALTHVARQDPVFSIPTHTNPTHWESCRW